MDAKDRHEIVEVKMYMDGRGREVREYIQVFGSNKQPNFYRGTVLIGVSQVVGGKQMPPRPMPFEFEMPEAKTLKQAFEIFDAVAKEEIAKKNEEVKAQQVANSIVPASTMPTPKLTLR